MSKELEAFDRVWEDCSKLDLDYVSKHNLMDDLREIKQALTPPTADDVCMALSEHLEVEVFYRETTKIFYTFWDSELITIAKLEINNDVLIFKQLPPHLITLISRFYEGGSEMITHEEARNELKQILLSKIDVLYDYITQQEKKDKLLELYKQAYDKSNAEVLKMFTMKQDEKTTLNNIIGHLDDNKTVAQIKELEK